LSKNASAALQLIVRGSATQQLFHSGKVLPSLTTVSATRQFHFIYRYFYLFWLQVQLYTFTSILARV
jgi:hypothetical protein